MIWPIPKSKIKPGYKLDKKLNKLPFRVAGDLLCLILIWYTAKSQPTCYITLLNVLQKAASEVLSFLMPLSDPFIQMTSLRQLLTSFKMEVRVTLPFVDLKTLQLRNW